VLREATRGTLSSTIGTSISLMALRRLDVLTRIGSAHRQYTWLWGKTKRSILASALNNLPQTAAT